MLKSCAVLDTEEVRRSVHRVKSRVLSVRNSMLQLVASIPEKQHWSSCIFLTDFIMYSGMNSLKYNYFKMVLQSRLRFRSSSRSDVSCSYISKNP